MKHDIVFIGGGPAGYVGAIRAAQLGMDVAVVEEAHLGGVCLNWGCIPTKALFSATKLIHHASTAHTMGITYAEPEIDLGQLATWKTDVISKLVAGIETLFEKMSIARYAERGRLANPGIVTLASGKEIEAKHVVLATGSSPIEIPGFSFDSPFVWSSDDALEIREIPERLAVIGGGVIGLELATIYARLGSKVTVFELLPDILATVDLDRRTVSTIKRSLKAQGIDVRTKTKVLSHAPSDTRTQLQVEGGDPVDADRILLAVGRRPNSADLGLADVGIEPDSRGFVVVTERFETCAPGVYAVGDLILGPMLAHKASADAVAVVEWIAEKKEPSLNYETIPQAIFTDPEISSVGLSETRAKEHGFEVLTGRFPFAALGKALGMREPDGFFQIVGDASTHRVLGVQIIGAEASDLISEAALAVQQELTLEAIADGVHAHPTLPEGLKEAAENALGRAIHTINR